MMGGWMMDQKISISEGRYIKEKKSWRIKFKKAKQLIQCMGDVRGHKTSSEILMKCNIFAVR